MNQKLTLAHQQMTADYEKMRQEEAEISAKLQERMSVAKSRHLGYTRVVGDDVLVDGDDVGDDEERSTLSGSFVGGGGGFDKNWLICDKGIVTEGDKRRLFSVIMNPKRRKEMLNASERHLRAIASSEGTEKDEKELVNLKRSQRRRRERRVVDKKEELVKKRNFRGLVRDVLEQLPFALPTLQLHIILSLTMVLLTHQCPVASYFIAV